MATTLTAEIVKLNTSVTAAPTPSQLQQSGALISLGGTTLATDDYQFVGTLAELEALLSGAGNSTELNAMGTTFFAQGAAVGCYVLELGVQTTVDSGVAALTTWMTNNQNVFYAYLTPAAWGDVVDQVGSITITDGGSGYSAAPTVTISAPTSGTTATATATVTGGVVTAVTITDPGSGYTTTPTVTFSAPTSGTTATGTANLASALDALVGNYSSPDSKTYFFITDTSSGSALYIPNKAAFVFVPSTTAASTEFGCAAPFYQWLANNPSVSSRLAPMQYRFLYGVTPWLQTGNTATINTILTNYANLALTGSEGGLTNTCLFKGFLGSGAQSSGWYGIDWIQIQAKQALAAAIINGSNSNPPLVYDETGVKTLAAVAQTIADNAVAFGCAQAATISYIPFYTYVKENPSDYAAGIYNGLTCTATFANGFATITFNLNAVEFVAAA